MFNYLKTVCVALTYSAIIQMLMSFPLSADVRDDVRAASYSLLSCETEGNNYPPVLGTGINHTHSVSESCYFLKSLKGALHAAWYPSP